MMLENCNCKEMRPTWKGVSEMKHLHLVRLGPPSYPEQEAFHSIDHGEPIQRKLVQ